MAGHGTDGAEAATTAASVAASLAQGGRLLGLRATQYGLAFVSGIIIARSLGPAGRALYALPLNLSGMVLVSVHLSVELAVARFVARKEATFHELSRVGVTAGLVLGSVGCAASIAIGLAVRDEVLGGASATVILLAAATIPPSILGQVTAALLLRRGVLQRYGLVQAAQGLLQLALLIAIAAGPGLTAEATLAVNLVVISAATAALMVFLRAELGAGALLPSRDVALLGRVVRAGLVLHASSLALYLNLRLDLLIVGAVLDERRAGIYSLAVTLAELGAVATTTISLAALRDQTELSERDAASYTLLFTQRTLRWAVLYAAVAAAGSYPFILLAYGSEWTDAVVPFCLLSMAVVALSLEAPARGLLLRIGRPWTVSAAAICALAVNVAVNIALLKPLGLVGAAIASIASYWTAALLMLLLARKAIRVLPPMQLPTST